MAELRVQVNEQTYSLACSDGEEDRVRSLSKYLDNHVQRLSNQISRGAESRLLILAALNICDELFVAREQLTNIQAPATTDPDWAAAASQAERLADKLSPEQSV